MIGLLRGPVRLETLRRCVRIVQAAVVLLCAAALFGLLRPVPAWQPPKLDAVATQPNKPAEPQQPLNLAVIWQRSLRQPPVDPPPPAAPAAAAEAPLPMRLVGTAVEPGRCFAVFALADNSVAVRELGGSISGYELIAVERGSARLRRGTREHELRVPWFDRIAAETASAGRGVP